MVKSRELINTKYPQISTYSCAAHTLNLLISDILKTDSVSDLEKKCTHIVKEVNNSHFLRARFNAIQKEKNSKAKALKMPVKTRWGSMLTCIKSLQETKYALKSLAVNEEASNILSKRSKSCILDDDVFWERVTKVQDLLIPIVKWITILESNKLRISMVVEAFREISDILKELVPSAPISKKEEGATLKSIKKRKSMALKPIHYAANILDPKFQGVNLSFDEQVDGTEFIHKMAESMEGVAAEEILSELAKYRAKEDFFGKSYVLKSVGSVSASTWWKGICIGSKLAKIAITVLSMPATTAATERSFSTYGIVHTARRNRLTTERSGKLAFLAHNLKLLKEETIPRCAFPTVQNSEADIESDDDELELSSETVDNCSVIEEE